MATFLSKLFKPKWQSKNNTTRLDAIEALDVNSEEDQNILLTLASNDKVSAVKAAAIAKISQTQKLIPLHKKADIESKPLIEQRLYELANAQSLSIFDLILDPELLTEMIIKSAKPNDFINGLARIEDPKSLLAIATQSKTSKIRQAAAELIESEQELKALTATAKSKDKTVYHIAKSKLEQIKDQIKAQSSLDESLDTILSALQDHAKTESINLYEARLESLKQRWNAICASAGTAQLESFQSTYLACRAKADAIVTAQQQEIEHATLIQAGGDEQQATLITLSDTLNRFRSTPASTQEISALDALLKTQETRWIEATRHSKVEKSQNKHYQLLMGEMRQYFSALQTLSDTSEKIATLIHEIKTSQNDARQLNLKSTQLKNALHNLGWPNEFAKPSALLDAEQALGYSKDINQKLLADAEEIQTQISKQITKLDQALEERQIKQSATQLKSIQRLLSQISAKQGESIHNQLSLRINQLNELRDWQGFASSPRQQELCLAMERLAEQSIEPRDKADKIKAMQKEWKSLGGASDQALWERFKTASDKAYEPCKAYFSEQKQLKANNLERRKTLIEQIDSFIVGNNWEQTDWKATEQINQQARLEWKSAYPIDHKANKALQSQFNTLLDKLDAHLNEERTRNLVLKTKVVDDAKALIEHESLDHAINQAKNLQKDWQNIGITSHKEDRALWREFRKTCDTIFARRDKARDERREEFNDAIQTADTFIETLKNYVTGLDEQPLETLTQGLNDFQKQYKQLPSLPKKKTESLEKAFEKLLTALKAHIHAQESKHVTLQWREVQRKSAILRQHYLQTETLDGEALKQLDQTFESQLKLSNDTESKLKSLWISVKAGAIKADKVVTFEQAHANCIQCEIAAGLESPESDNVLRMQLQVSRLSEGMASSDYLSREDQLSDLLNHWYLTVGLTLDEQESLESRVNSALESILV